MPKPTVSRVLLLLGYELSVFPEALGLRVVFGNAAAGSAGRERQTPTLLLTPEEARELARDLIEAAERVQLRDEPATSLPLH
jgi:hypothetical protein